VIATGGSPALDVVAGDVTDTETAQGAARRRNGYFMSAVNIALIQIVHSSI
jgi:hypothetical protein